MFKTNYKVIICGVVKNVELVIDKNIKYAIETGNLFEKFKIVIYENNSTDNTKDLLHSYDNNKNIKIICENIDKKQNNKIWTYTEVTGSDHPCRIEHICNARNKLLEEINKPEYDEYTHVIVIDFDSNGWDIKGILNSFMIEDKWDAIFANSSDYYALRIPIFPFGPEIIGEFFWNLPNYRFTNELVPDYSAFNGIGIYKKDIFKKFKYDFVSNDDVKKFYRKYIDDNIITDSTIFWKSNCGYKGIVLCEHVPLHFALYNNGYKLFINPNMIYYYK